MSTIQNVQSDDGPKRSVFVFGDLPWTGTRVIRESLDAGLRVVLAKLVSDTSGSVQSRIPRESEVLDRQTMIYTTEVLPDQPSAISGEMLERLRQQYGADWCVLPLNDYSTEYAATISGLAESCYPPRSAEIVRRKHELRGIWNELASRSGSGLSVVEYCYVELSNNDDDQFEFHPSAGFEALPEETRLIVKPDELSSSIEIHWAATKKEAVTKARNICANLRSKWRKVGQIIGTEVRPRVVMETAIERSSSLHLGAEFSVEFVSFRGQHHAVGITQKWTGANFLETGHLFPAESFPLWLKPVLEQAIHELLEHLGVQYGVSHWEFIVTPDERIALVEGHLRAAGDRIMELVEYSTGRSPTAALFEALAQGKANFSFEPRTSCGIFWMVPQTPLEEVTDITIAPATTEVACKDVYIKHEGVRASSNWSHATDWTMRYAHLIVTGPNLDSITRCCRRVAHNVVLSGKIGGDAASTPLTLAIDQITPFGSPAIPEQTSIRAESLRT